MKDVIQSSSYCGDLPLLHDCCSLHVKISKSIAGDASMTNDSVGSDAQRTRAAELETWSIIIRTFFLDCLLI